MAKPKKKQSTHTPELVISVSKFKYLFYKGKMMRYPRLVKILDLDAVSFRDRFKEMPRLSYDGIMGAPLREPDKAIEVARTLLPELSKNEWSVETRFRVMHGDVVSSDKPFSFKHGAYPKCDNEGFLNRKAAFIAAEEHYTVHRDFLYNGHGQAPSGKVSLVLADSKGNVVKALSNHRKTLRSDKS